MIKITDNSKCCGCGACVQVCPKHCICMVEDEEGFMYPKVESSLCINCNLCERTCPEQHNIQARNPLQVFAAKNKKEDIRLISSSGGVFTELAESVIDEGGVVFGVCFNEHWEVIHDYVESKHDLQKFRGSKYVQSSIGNTYIEAKDFLESGRTVLFSGTSCQIQGLLSFLRKDYSNLITVDVICHGVPSPKVWKSYIKKISFHKKISSINFRDKITGWKNYSSQLYFFCRGQNNSISLLNFMRLFTSNMILRPSCHNCPFKNGKSGSDITLGDFWGIETIMPEFDDDKGVSLILIYKEGVYKYLKGKLDIRTLKYEDAVLLNQNIVSSSVPHCNRNFFFYRLTKTKNVQKAFEQLYSKNLLMRVYRTIYRRLYK